MHTGSDLRGGAFSTPLGTIVGLASTRGLRAVTFDLDALVEVDQEPGDPTLETFARWLVAYFAGKFDALPELPLDLPQSPSREIWQAVCRVGPGRIATYGQIAKLIGKPQQARVVGAAVGRNPVMLVVPCHRVIAGNGSLTGYGGGIERKAWLLRHEGVLLV